MPISLSGFWIFTKKDKCYDIFGEEMCFPTSSPFTNTFGMAPESPADQKVAFVLYTPANTDTPYYLDGNNVNSLQSSPFDSSKMTRVIIHGYNDNIRKPYIKTMKQELLKYVRIYFWDERILIILLKTTTATSTVMTIPIMIKIMMTARLWSQVRFPHLLFRLLGLSQVVYEPFTVHGNRLSAVSLVNHYWLHVIPIYLLIHLFDWCFTLYIL